MDYSDTVYSIHCRSVPIRENESICLHTPNYPGNFAETYIRGTLRRIPVKKSKELDPKRVQALSKWVDRLKQNRQNG